MRATRARVDEQIARPANPYVGPRSFTEADQQLFFGRENEARDLLALVLADRVVVFYAQSGAGKTSLINARLIPSLRAREFDVLPVGRVGGKPVDVEVANVFTFNLLSRISAENPDIASRPNLQADLARLSLARYFGASAAHGTSNQPTGYKAVPTLLIVDQFEELFTAEAADARARLGFFEQLRELQDAFASVWVVLVMREEFVAHLDTVAHVMQNRLQSRFYMQRMPPAAALEAIREPAKARGIPFDDDAAQQLVNELRRIRVQTLAGKVATVPGAFIEPVQLQVVCYTLWENLPPAVSRIDANHVHQFGNVDQALLGFYERAVATASSSTGVSNGRIRDWFQSRMITTGGTRGFAYRGPDDTGGLPNRAVDVLEREHLVRAEPRAGAIWIELTHDRLIEPIQAANAVWMRRKGRNRLIWAAAAAVGVASILLILLSVQVVTQQATATYVSQVVATATIVQSLATQAGATAVVAQSLATQAGATAIVAQSLATQAGATAVVAQGLASRADAAAAGYQSQLSTQTSLRVQSLLAPTRTAVSLRATDAASTSTALAANTSTPDAVTPSPTQPATTATPGSSSTGTPLAVTATPRPTPLAIPTPAPVAPTAGTTTPTAETSPATRTAVPTRSQTESTPTPGSTRAPTAVTAAAPAWSRTFIAEASSIDAYWVDYDQAKHRAVTAGADGTVRVWDSFGQKASKTWDSGKGAVYTATSSPDGSRVLVGGAGSLAEVWDLASGSRLYTLQGHSNDVIASTWNQDGTRMATGSFDLSAIVWDATNGTMLRQLLGHSDVVSSVAFAPRAADGRQLVATGSWDGTARVWDVGSGAFVSVPRGAPTGPGGKVWSVAFTPDGRYLLTGSDDGYIRWWTLEGDPVAQWSGHTAGVTSLTFSPNGRLLLSTSGDSTTRVWDVGSGVSQEQSDGTVLIWSGTFLDNDHFLTVASDGNLRMWSTP